MMLFLLLFLFLLLLHRCHGGGFCCCDFGGALGLAVASAVLVVCEVHEFCLPLSWRTLRLCVDWFLMHSLLRWLAAKVCQDANCKDLFEPVGFVQVQQPLSAEVLKNVLAELDVNQDKGWRSSD